MNIDTEYELISDAVKKFEIQIRYFPSHEDFRWSEEFWLNLGYWKAQIEIRDYLEERK